MSKTPILSYTPKALAQKLVEEGFKSFNASQIFDWVYRKKELDFLEMTNLPQTLRGFLDEHYSIDLLHEIIRQTSEDGTVKFLFSLHDGFAIESVLMTHEYGLSLCVTSQVGCSMGCTFCASGLKKRTRNLEVFELVSQILTVEHLLQVKISHVVVMGTGEPFDNYDNVINFIKIINDKMGLAIGQRHITVSTCGIVPRIYQYAEEPIRSNLAISLHAPNDALRTSLMPINKRYPLAEVIEACKVYFEKTSRRVTFEYILLGGVNDSISQADELSDLLRGLNAYVNLIPYNPVSEFDHQKTDSETASRFFDRLIKRGIVATLRREQGGDIDAACGQLRMKSERK